MTMRLRLTGLDDESGHGQPGGFDYAVGLLAGTPVGPLNKLGSYINRIRTLCMISKTQQLKCGREPTSPKRKP